jgi:hypothetical protein
VTDKPEGADAGNDMKRKFKEALEQKSKGARARKAHEEGRAKVGGMQDASATRKRNFRRKTG